MPRMPLEEEKANQPQAQVWHFTGTYFVAVSMAKRAYFFALIMSIDHWPAALYGLLKASVK